MLERFRKRQVFLQRKLLHYKFKEAVAMVETVTESIGRRKVFFG